MSEMAANAAIAVRNTLQGMIRKATTSSRTPSSAASQLESIAKNAEFQGHYDIAEYARHLIDQFRGRASGLQSGIPATFGDMALGATNGAYHQYGGRFGNGYYRQMMTHPRQLHPNLHFQQMPYRQPVGGMYHGQPLHQPGLQPGMSAQVGVPYAEYANGAMDNGMAYTMEIQPWVEQRLDDIARHANSWNGGWEKHVADLAKTDGLTLGDQILIAHEGATEKEILIALAQRQDLTPELAQTILNLTQQVGYVFWNASKIKNAIKQNPAATPFLPSLIGL